MLRKTSYFLIFVSFLFSSFYLLADTPPLKSAAESQETSPSSPPSSPSNIFPDMGTEEQTPPGGETETYETTFIKMILTLFALVLLIVFTVWMLRRLSHGRTGQLNLNRAIKIIERRALSQKSVLYLIKVGNKQVLIAESQLEVRAIADIEEAPPEMD